MVSINLLMKMETDSKVLGLIINGMEKGVYFSTTGNITWATGSILLLNLILGNSIISKATESTTITMAVDTLDSGKAARNMAKELIFKRTLPATKVSFLKI